MTTIQVRDIQTKQVFNVSPTENRVNIITRDGVTVRLHPIIIRTMVGRGQKFDGHTITGPREMERVS